MGAEHTLKRMFAEAGVKFQGKNKGGIQVHDDRFYRRVLRGGSLALGESYVEGWWDSKELDACIYQLLRAGMESKVKSWKQQFLEHIWSRLVNLQSKLRAGRQGGMHYNLGDTLFKEMLGQYMVYSCAYWKAADNLDAAQKAKMDLICRKLEMMEGQKLLDIGCGWGELAKFAAENYGVEVVGITVSENQAAYARSLCSGLPVEIKVMDYRDLSGVFDRIVSVGMFEHVGSRNYRTYMQVAGKCLKPDGLFVMHTIGGNKSVRTTDPWLDKYIFPGSQIPSMRQIADAYEGVFVCEDWHNIGPDYDRTLMAWHDNFNAAWDRLKGKYDVRFRRMWNYYLLICAASFRARKNHVWQFVFSSSGMPGKRYVRKD